ncbi:hypothetical protein HY407_05365 [Candidatus Gottesmanbacteria bacterium]|nr:hypothetical protein [Candidatus Gottesmanbacteria bacterium]
MVVMQTRGSSKLTPKERKELIVDLCRSLVVLRSTEEVAEALTDLLTPKEVETIAKRLKIAEYLSSGKDYVYIRDVLKVGYSTIARVNTWLNLSGVGFKVMLSRRKKSPKQESIEEIYDPLSWRNIKRRYSLYFWPQLLFEEIVKTADRGEKKKIADAFEKLDLKRRRFNKWENKQLYQMFSSKLTLKGKTR